MLIPISWLKDFVEIKLPLKDLMWKMTEAGLTCESYTKAGDEIVLDVEVTANRPDWMSIIGVAREVAAIQGVSLKKQKEINLPKKSGNLPIDLIPDFTLFDRWTGIVIKDVKITPSPKWLAERIKLMGHTPINNVIDITNYVMYELGIPMHAFDYDEIAGQIMTVQKSAGGEEFTSVDDLKYKLPKDAIIIRDAERLIDLAGIKGGLNSGIKDSTKNIFLHVTIDNPVLVRRASIALGLRSEASAIYERVPDKGGTINSIKHAAKLILNLTGGKIASEIIDLKKEKFEPWNLELEFKKMKKVLGIEIPPETAVKILKLLNLSPKKTESEIKCTIPTYRADLKIEEDLVEEVARIYGYNKFPMTLPEGKITGTKIPYFFDDRLILKLKELATSSGYSEAMTLSLISGNTIEKFGLKTSDHIKLTNPVSSEYEYMRQSLIPSLLSALKLNNQESVKLFEIDKVYIRTAKKPEEIYKFAGIVRGTNFRKFKGILDLIFERLNISKYQIEFETNKSYLHPSNAGAIKIGNDIAGEFGEISPQVLANFEIKENIFIFELDVKALEKHAATGNFEQIPENPPQIEDTTLTFPPKTKIGEVIEEVYGISNIVYGVELKDIYKDSYTFRIWYQGKNKNLTDAEVEEIRKKILTMIKQKFGGTIKN